jgi:toxin secretion/phage lysis holin
MELAVAKTTLAKNLSYICAFVAGLGLSPDSLGILAVFMFIDTILGVVRSIVIHGGNSFRSRLLAHGLISKLLVLFIPILLVYTGRGAGVNFLPVAIGTISVLILAEAYSILGHIQSIRTKKDVKEFDAISMVLAQVRSVVEKLLVTSKK